MFKGPQWVGGEQLVHGAVRLDHVIGLRGGERVLNVAASDLSILTSGDLPANLVAAIRTVQPRAYSAWTADEEAALREMWERGAEIPAMVSALGRRWSGIKARAKKLGLPPRAGSGTP
ncbi:hypothetical protein EDD29_6430 [Actinocorallia herbida]|uniref:Uncharacterized protein n=2 Tax=Actinocorallia herbida TaxID=58109 RepID=A0A3N1D5C8_9ACTN|nr:hypothetical protein EDD29_6430 [Actinocorallia herbida]